MRIPSFVVMALNLAVLSITLGTPDTAWADDLLSLGTFSENDRPAYGENIVVIKDDHTGLKAVTSVEDTTGKMEIPITLSGGDFEFTLEMFDAGIGEMAIIFSRGNQTLFFRVWPNILISLENNFTSVSELPVWQRDGTNEFKLEVTGNTARLLVNGTVAQEANLPEEKLGVVYDKLVVTNVNQHLIYKMDLINGTSGSEFAATVSSDLTNLDIPQVNLETTDGVRKLWAVLRLVPNEEGRILFEVIDFGPYPGTR